MVRRTISLLLPISFLFCLVATGMDISQEEKKNPQSTNKGKLRSFSESEIDQQRKVEEILTLAEQGDSQAQFELGKIYKDGFVVPQNDLEALKWFKKSAEQGLASAQFELGRMFYLGQGVLQNKEEAAKWFLQAADKGLVSAQQSLADMYYSGDGVHQDRREAARWFKVLAEAGVADAQFTLGTMYDNGDGVSKNKLWAAMWYRMAAEQGNPKAQFNLGVMCSEGEGVVKNKAEAIEWFRRAAVQGMAEAQFNLAISYASGEGNLQSGAAAADWYYRAGLNYLKEGRNDKALLCVERIKNLNQILGLTVPNIQLADQLLDRIYGGGTTRNSNPAPSEAPHEVSIGTAWVASQGFVVTNFHVIEGHRSLRLIFPNGSNYEALVEEIDRANDLAILRVTGTIDLPPALPLAKKAVQSGASVFTVGYPLPDFMGQKPKLTNGIISSTTGAEDDARLLQITVPVQAGNSGGPLINMEGQVVGVVMAKLNAVKVFRWTGDLPENVNYAVKIVYLLALAGDKLQAAPEATGLSSTQSLEILANRVTQSIAMVVAE